jgi:hypothetical protein
MLHQGWSMARASGYPATGSPAERLRAAGMVLIRSLGAVVAAALILVNMTSCTTASSRVAGPTSTPTTTISQSALTVAVRGWPNDKDCSFAADGYHIKGGFLCGPVVGLLGDVVISVDVKQISGQLVDPYGIAFRWLGMDNYYQLGVDGNGEWVFFKCDAVKCTTAIQYTANSVIRGGLNAMNTLQVRAVGSHFDFFVNGTKVGQADDATYPSGQVALLGFSGIECVFTNFKITRPT